MCTKQIALLAETGGCGTGLRQEKAVKIKSACLWGIIFYS